MATVLSFRSNPTTAPIAESGKVNPPRRVPDKDRRAREHLTPNEVDTLMTAADRLGRHEHRNATLILIAYRHGLRVGELVSLRWDQVNPNEGLLHVVRLKRGAPGVVLRILWGADGAAGTRRERVTGCLEPDGWLMRMDFSDIERKK